ncbi:hypothetical protein Tco_0192094, partial [Tanacetum coccineum]
MDDWFLLDGFCWLYYVSAGSYPSCWTDGFCWLYYVSAGSYSSCWVLFLLPLVTWFLLIVSNPAGGTMYLLPEECVLTALGGHHLPEKAADKLIFHSKDLLLLRRRMNKYFRLNPDVDVGLDLWRDVNMLCQSLHSDDVEDFWRTQDEWVVGGWRLYPKSSVH